MQSCTHKHNYVLQQLPACHVFHRSQVAASFELLRFNFTQRCKLKSMRCPCDVQAGKSITGILKPLEILTRPQLPRKAPVAAAGQAHQAGAAAASQAPAAPAAGTAPGSSGTAAGAAGSQTAQQTAPPAEVCVSHPSLSAKQHVCTCLGVSAVGLFTRSWVAGLWPGGGGWRMHAGLSMPTTLVLLSALLCFACTTPQLHKTPQDTCSPQRECLFRMQQSLQSLTIILQAVVLLTSACIMC